LTLVAKRCLPLFLGVVRSLRFFTIRPLFHDPKWSRFVFPPPRSIIFINEKTPQEFLAVSTPLRMFRTLTLCHQVAVPTPGLALPFFLLWSVLLSRLQTQNVPPLTFFWGCPPFFSPKHLISSSFSVVLRFTPNRWEVCDLCETGLPSPSTSPPLCPELVLARADFFLPRTFMRVLGESPAGKVPHNGLGQFFLFPYRFKR